jgi:cytoskeletal protein CcmA (bactofilin family)
MVWFDRNPSGKKGHEEERPTSAEPQPVSVPASPKEVPIVKAAPPPVEPELVALLHKGSRVTGQLMFQGPARIDGSVEGEIQCHGKLTIGEGAEVRAKISSQIVIIQGRVEGNVTATEKIELVAPARLYGNVSTPRLIITEGVVFDGDCSMGVAKQKGGAATAQSVSADKAEAPASKRQADSEH